ncbi:acyl-CoA-binding domain-containing protein 5 [Euwallacea fornicatus]|uniref:acyl-CoA-binding domain-containing protein 5 n=1 Tax=Euwallacea fornicatus TaxID=995702 RepID=UPI00338D5DC2
MTTEEKFNAAVNVIRSLPKNGSYQPSNELMLRFYSYFKQATQGPCLSTRPGFWDIVGRAKYDAWKQLGDMSRNEAMKKYVDELHSIVETMSFSDKVANFLEAPTNELDSINFDDLELVAGDVLERVRSQPNTPLASRESSPIRFVSSKASSRCESPIIVKEESDDEFLEPIEVPMIDGEELEEKLAMLNGTVTHIPQTRMRPHSCSVDISQEVARTVQSLRIDLARLTERVSMLEPSLKKSLARRKKPIFGELRPQIAIFIIIWPFIVSFIVNRWSLRRK